MKKILVFSNGEKLGDGIIKLPFIYDLKKSFNDSQIYWLTNGIRQMAKSALPTSPH